MVSLQLNDINLRKIFDRSLILLLNMTVYRCEVRFSIKAHEVHL